MPENGRFPEIHYLWILRAAEVTAPILFPSVYWQGAVSWILRLPLGGITVT